MDPLVPLGVKQVFSVFRILSRSLYYEWNDRDRVWAKLNSQDPDPPANLPPGKFDGQIVEIQK